MLGKTWTGSTSVEKALDILAGSELSMEQLCALAIRRTNSIVGYANRITARKPREGLFPLLGTY